MISTNNAYKYGNTQLRLNLPSNFSVDTIVSQEIPAVPEPRLSVLRALDSALNFNFEHHKAAKTAAIAINDKTRPVPHHILIPPLLEKLAESGISPRSITFIIASGTHTPMKEEEFHLILPDEILSNFRITSHDCDDLQNLVDLGFSSRRTPILINRNFYEADLRIVTGNIEPHHFMGFSGGAKSASIGLAGRETINQNHSLLVDPDSRIGEYGKNKMRQEVEEIGRRVGVHFALNAILNNDREIVNVFAGDPSSVMQQGISLVNSVCQTQVSHPYDLVIASAGGYPKDINFYQSQKALTNAARIVKDGGTIILAAECIEGIGSPPFEKFMEDIHSWDEVFEKFQRIGFQIGPHKALQIAHIARRAKIILVSSLDPQKVKAMHLLPAASIEAAISIVMPSLSDRPCVVAFLPLAVTTIPKLISTSVEL
jgi:lactate racemase